MTEYGFRPLSELTRLPIEEKGTVLTRLVAELDEVMPQHGIQQNVRLRMPSGFVVDAWIWEHNHAIPRAAEGGVIVVTGPVDGKGGIKWERSKADGPAANRGVVCIRARARISIYTKAQVASMPEVRELGFSVPTPKEPGEASTAPRGSVQPSPAAPAPAMPQPVSSILAAIPGLAPFQPAAMAPMSPVVERAALYAQCLSAVRLTLGGSADPEEVRNAANAVFNSFCGQQAPRVA